ncbi:MAG: SusC/RagA family TonB-linked outer membrane protein [Balneolaceae bacterium]
MNTKYHRYRNQKMCRKSSPFFQLTLVALALILSGFVGPNHVDDVVGQNLETEYLTSLHSSNSQISLELRNVTIEEALQALVKEANIGLSYNADVIPDGSVSISVQNASVSEVLFDLLKDHGLEAVMAPNRSTLVIQRANTPASDALGVEAFQNTVRGQVVDSSTDQTLPGVNVVVQGTNIGAVTDADGNFELSVPSLNETLVISYIGYQTQEINLAGRSSLDIALESAVLTGQDLVVTAFGLQREQRSLSYSTQGVGTETLTEARELNVITSLQGKVAGLTMNTGASGLGSEARVILRGNRSISGDSQPLYVVDGVPIRGTVSNLNPDNIESINVLKGANAAALYGSSAANGVIVIETLQGQPGRVDISLNNTFMALTPIHYMNFQSEYGQGSGGVYEKSNERSWGPPLDGRMVDHWSLDPADAGTQYAFTPQPNNKTDIYQTGIDMSSNLLARIGGETTQAVFSYTYADAVGIVPENALRRHNVSVRVTSQLTDRLNLDAKLDYSNQLIDGSIPQGRSNFNRNRQIYMVPPNIRTEHLKNFEFQDANGLNKQNFYNPGTTTGSNPYWMIFRNIRETTRERVIALTSLTYDFSESTSLMVRGSYDGETNRGTQKFYNDTYTRADFGRYSVNQGNALEYSGDFLLSHERELTEDFDLSASAGGSLIRHGNSSLSSHTGDGLLIPNYFALSNTSRVQSSHNPGEHYETQSLYAFAQLGWRDVIYLDVTGRNDWSSTLPAENRSYFYPSAGTSVILSDLIPDFPDLFSFASLRFSWAQVGNSAPPYMGFRNANFQAGGNNGFMSLSGVLPNENLLPEETESFELGLDLRFLEGRVGLDIAAYKTNTRNQLFTIALPIVSGATSFFTNGGDVENKGLEFVLSTRPVQTRDFNMNVDFNFALNRNTVKRISDDRPRVVAGGDPYFLDLYVEQGRPFGELYSRGFERDSEGRVIVASNGLPRITSSSNVNIGNFSPDWMGGISTSFNYRNISASFLIDHRQGGVMATMTNAILADYGQLEQTAKGREGGLVFGDNLFGHEEAVLEDGSPNNIEVKAQSFWQTVGGEAAPAGEAFAESTTNTRLREVTIGYSLPQSVVGTIGIRNAKISLVGRNLFYIYRESENLDPDVTVGTGPGSQGFQNFAPPTTRSIGANLKIDF